MLTFLKRRDGILKLFKSTKSCFQGVFESSSFTQYKVLQSVEIYKFLNV